MRERNQSCLEAQMNRLNTISNECGMKIKIRRTKVLEMSKGKGTFVGIHIGGKEPE